jgi:hypothetical protein
LENCIVVRKQRLDYGMHLIVERVHVLSCSNSAMKGDAVMGPTEYHDIAAQTITEPPPCRVLLMEPDIGDWVFSNRKLFLM